VPSVIIREYKNPIQFINPEDFFGCGTFFIWKHRIFANQRRRKQKKKNNASTVFDKKIEVAANPVRQFNQEAVE